ncbi:MAG: hypothetical protein WCB00_05590, partial [Candidatus Acidiferrales bacterium]
SKPRPAQIWECGGLPPPVPGEARLAAGHTGKPPNRRRSLNQVPLSGRGLAKTLVPTVFPKNCLYLC